MNMMLLSKLKVATAMLLVIFALAASRTGLAFQAQATKPSQHGILQRAIDEKKEGHRRLADRQTEVGPRTEDQGQRTESPLSPIMSGVQTIDDLEYAKSFIEQMIAFEKEIQGKSPEELAKIMKEGQRQIQ
jgi:hypothetical protein